MSEPSNPSRATERSALPLHHVAFACRDLVATQHFYEDLLGLPLVHTEVNEFRDGYFRHVFFDLGDGSCIAFFDLHGVGERDDFETDLSKLGAPRWVNHVALRADSTTRAKVAATMAAAGVEPAMDIDHGWCHSTYYLDPNGVLIELCEDTPGMPIDPAEAALLIDSVPAGQR